MSKVEGGNEQNSRPYAQPVSGETWVVNKSKNAVGEQGDGSVSHPKIRGYIGMCVFLYRFGVEPI